MAIQRDAPADYDVAALEGLAPTYRAENEAHGLTVLFEPEGPIVETRGGPAWRLGLRLEGYGRGADIRPAPLTNLVAEGNRVEYRRGGTAEAPLLSEWYVNGALGLEQGFTLAAPPPGAERGAGDLRLVLGLSGGLEPALNADGRDLRLEDAAGAMVLSYHGLYAYDATGRALPARLLLAGQRLTIHVADSGAVYPLTIDPLLSRQTKLTAGDAAMGDQFGYSVAISGDTVVVGAVGDDDAGFSSGSAYVFQRSGAAWSEQAKLTASDGAVGDSFGQSVAISGDTVVAGAPQDDDTGSNSGSAYVFQRSGTAWSEQAKLTAGDAAAGDAFGWSVAISGDTVVVGAYVDNDAGSNSGSAYVFQRSGTAWSEQAKLTAGDGAASDLFGWSVAISGNTAVVGARGDDDAGSASGSAYVFQRSGTAWSEQAKLTAGDGASLDLFGTSVGISGDTVVAGAPQDDDTGSNSGSAYVFQRSGTAWSEQAKLTASDGAADDIFGESVGISGDAVVVGAFRDDDLGSDSGSAYVFRRVGTAWSEQAKLTAGDGAQGDFFGQTVAISGDTVVAGAYQDDDAGNASGSAYLFEFFFVLDHVAVADSWQTVPLPVPFADPVVIAGPPTFHGRQPGVVRLRLVGTDSFQARFQEWPYLDGVHAEEDLPYLVMEAGRQVMPDGSIWEAGTFPLGGTGVFHEEFFSQPFPGPPALFLSGQTARGADAVTVRARNVTAAGFEAALFEQEDQMGSGHTNEEVGYLAIYNPQGSGSIPLLGGTVPYLLQSPTVDRRFTPVLSWALNAEEEKSEDGETAHASESLAVLALGGQLFAQDVSTNGADPAALRRLAPEFGAPLEWGTVDGVTNAWTTVPLARHYLNPVVVARPVSANGADPGVIRLGNVTGNAFDLRYQEWNYLDGTHAPERVFYMVAEAGSHDLDGLLVEAGTLVTDRLLGDGFETVGFAATFADRPAVFSTVQNARGSDAVTTRLAGVTALGFSVTMQEEQATGDFHISETIGWIAIERGATTTTDGRDVLVFDGAATDQPTAIPFGQVFNRRFPVLLGDIASTAGGDPVFMRYQNLTPSSVQLFLQEEQSFDAETDHVLEELSIFVAE
ncbi:MAG: FG-GAP repeat protein [Kiloniellales bacterium]|nr:FG-GAP repeat protein [Kiloniellales bacterium]